MFHDAEHPRVVVRTIDDGNFGIGFGTGIDFVVFVFLLRLDDLHFETFGRKLHGVVIDGWVEEDFPREKRLRVAALADA